MPHLSVDMLVSTHLATVPSLSSVGQFVFLVFDSKQQVEDIYLQCTNNYQEVILYILFELGNDTDHILMGGCYQRT